MYIVKASPKIKNLKLLEKKIKGYLKYIEIVNKAKLLSKTIRDNDISLIKEIILSLRELRGILDSIQTNNLLIIYKLIYKSIKEEILRSKDLHSTLLDLILTDDFDKKLIGKLIKNDIEEINTFAYINNSSYKSLEKILKLYKKQNKPLMDELVIKSILLCTDNETMEKKYKELFKEEEEKSLKSMSQILTKSELLERTLTKYTTLKKQYIHNKNILKKQMPAFILSLSLSLGLMGGFTGLAASTCRIKKYRTETITYTSESSEPNIHESWELFLDSLRAKTRIDYVPLRYKVDGEEYVIKKTYDVSSYNFENYDDYFSLDLPLENIEIVLKEENIPSDKLFQKIIEIKQYYSKYKSNLDIPAFITISLLLIAGTIMLNLLLVLGDFNLYRHIEEYIKNQIEKIKVCNSRKEANKLLYETVKEIDELLSNNEEAYKKYKKLENEILKLFSDISDFPKINENYEQIEKEKIRMQKLSKTINQ